MCLFNVSCCSLSENQMVETGPALTAKSFALVNKQCEPQSPELNLFLPASFLPCGGLVVVS